MVYLCKAYKSTHFYLDLDKEKPIGLKPLCVIAVSKVCCTVPV